MPLPRPFGLDTTLGEILKTGKMEGDPGLGVHENLAVVAGGKGWWSWKVGERSFDVGDWFSLCVYNVHRLLGTAGKSIGTWQRGGGEGCS